MADVVHAQLGAACKCVGSKGPVTKKAYAAVAGMVWAAPRL